MTRHIEAMLAVFLRHAEAEPEAADDFSRKLTPKGLDQAARAGRFLERAGLGFDRVLSSPVVRAWQTAEAVARKLGGNPPQPADWLACGMTPETCMSKLAGLEKCASVLLVGHEPDFSGTLSAWIGAPDGDAVHVRKASLTGLDVSGFSPGSGRIEFLIPARLM